jgi:molybdopterin-containing oxidoreductase family iron-sulfur binding subunit
VAAAAAGINSAGKSGALELVLYEKIGLGNGRYANNPWLQELPDPVSRVVWDNYLVVSPKFAHDQKLYDALGNAAELDPEVPLVNVKSGNVSVDLPFTFFLVNRIMLWQLL